MEENKEIDKGRGLIFSIYLVAVFLNAFVDLGHKIIIQNTIFMIYGEQQQIILTAIVNAMILVPFILLFKCQATFLINLQRQVSCAIAHFLLY